MKSLSGSARDTYVAAHSRILAMTKFCPERDAVARVGYQRSKPPTYDAEHNKLTEGVPEKLAVEAVDWRPEGEYHIDNQYDVLMNEPETQFRYNNERAIHEIRSFTALPRETTSQRHSRLACLIAENPTIVHGEMAERLFLERYAYTRGGTYLSKLKQYRVGDIVYVKRRATDTLDCSASPIILHIIKIKPDYTLVLQGMDGCIIIDRARNTAPCYLPDVSDEYDPARCCPEADHRCEVCHRIYSPDTMLLGDGCNLGFHMEYMTSLMTEVIFGELYCPHYPNVPEAA